MTRLAFTSAIVVTLAYAAIVAALMLSERSWGFAIVALLLAGNLAFLILGCVNGRDGPEEWAVFGWLAFAVAIGVGVYVSLEGFAYPSIMLVAGHLPIFVSLQSGLTREGAVATAIVLLLVSSVAFFAANGRLRDRPRDYPATSGPPASQPPSRARRNSVFSEELGRSSDLKKCLPRPRSK